ncbi:putative tRNA synthetase [Neospora caninum Liverpool]|uniref:valine--tRNA ligase n=1 Tax=Neospora caninum (strain Liverpool) TaxID=572307 RepID=F0VPA3_NEOCL|nr:putative tRNA synthetase [Neospora caninum Liverpool]CBZ55549.1 putative tRNA synthetase [Neospora caninum Liverpool]|eukprot:XP_003885577.1 putative tRNA synthetase [Neospora caninum Liverpool]
MMALGRSFPPAGLLFFLHLLFPFVPSLFPAEAVHGSSPWKVRASPRTGSLSLAAIDEAGHAPSSPVTSFPPPKNPGKRRQLRNRTHFLDPHRHTWDAWKASPSGAVSGTASPLPSAFFSKFSSLCGFFVGETAAESSGETIGDSHGRIGTGGGEHPAGAESASPVKRKRRRLPRSKATGRHTCQGWRGRPSEEDGFPSYAFLGSSLSSASLGPTAVLSQTVGRRLWPSQPSRLPHSALPDRPKYARDANEACGAFSTSVQNWADTRGSTRRARIPEAFCRNVLEGRDAERGRRRGAEGSRDELFRRPPTLLRSSPPSSEHAGNERAEEKPLKEPPASGLPRAFPHRTWERCLYTWWEETLGVFDAATAAASVLSDRTVPSRPLLVGREENADAVPPETSANASRGPSARPIGPRRSPLSLAAIQNELRGCETLHESSPGGREMATDSQTPCSSRRRDANMHNQRSTDREVHTAEAKSELSVGPRAWTRPPQAENEREAVRDAPRFRLLMPPPNLTGPLHLGHAASLALQELLVRFRRMLLVTAHARGRGERQESADARGDEEEAAERRGDREEDMQSAETGETGRARVLAHAEREHGTHERTQLGGEDQETDRFRLAGSERTFAGKKGEGGSRDCGENGQRGAGAGVLTACRTEWIPGTDHAGLAMAWLLRRHELRVRERRQRTRGLQQDGEKAHEAALLNRWVSVCRHVIERQQRRLGCSCDWTRRVYTLERSYCDLVSRAFVQLYRQKYIQRGTYLTLWDTGAHTALADFEVLYPSLDAFREAEKTVLEGKTARENVASPHAQTPRAGTQASGAEDETERTLAGDPEAPGNSGAVSGAFLRDERRSENRRRETEKPGEKAKREEARRFYFLSCRLLPVALASGPSSRPRVVGELALPSVPAQAATHDGRDSERSRVDGEGQSEEDGDPETAPDMRVAICLEAPRQLTQITAICIKPQAFRRLCAQGEERDASRVPGFSRAPASSWQVEVPGLNRSVPLVVHDGEHLHPLAGAAAVRLRQLRGLQPSSASPSSTPFRRGDALGSGCLLPSATGRVRSLHTRGLSPSAPTGAANSGSEAGEARREKERELATRTEFVGFAVFSGEDSSAPSQPRRRGTGEAPARGAGSGAASAETRGASPGAPSKTQGSPGDVTPAREALHDVMAREDVSLGVWEDEPEGGEEAGAHKPRSGFLLQWPRWISTRTGAEVQARLSSQWLLDLPALARVAQKAATQQRAFRLRESYREDGRSSSPSTEKVRGASSKDEQLQSPEASLGESPRSPRAADEKGGFLSGETEDERDEARREDERNEGDGDEGGKSTGLQLLPERVERQWSRILGAKGSLRPWCLSRQLAWGVPVPVWHVKLSDAPERDSEEGGQSAGFEWDEVAASEEDMWLSVEAEIASRLRDLGLDSAKDRATALVRQARMQRSVGEKKDPMHHDEKPHGEAPPETETHSEGDRLRLTVTRSRDVLDTWFSSALWPLACARATQHETGRETRKELTQITFPSSFSHSHLPASSSSPFVSDSSSPSSSSSSSSSSPSSSFWHSSCWDLSAASGFPFVRRLSALSADAFQLETELVTGEDILFFWVLRQFILCSALTQRAPFTRVTLHGLLVDRDGKKLSKTKGNVERGYLDRLIDEAGADALRWTFLSAMTPGAAVAFDEEALAAARRFLHKLWNAGRFIERFASQFPPPAYARTDAEPAGREPVPKGETKGTQGGSESDRRGRCSPLVARYYWSRALQVAHEVTELLKKMEAAAAAHAVQTFLWLDVADWLLPAAAAVRAQKDGDREGDREKEEGDREGERVEEDEGENRGTGVGGAEGMSLERPELDTEALRLFPVVQRVVRRLRRALKEFSETPKRVKKTEGDAVAEKVTDRREEDERREGAEARVDAAREWKTSWPEEPAGAASRTEEDATHGKMREKTREATLSDEACTHGDTEGRTSRNQTGTGRTPAAGEGREKTNKTVDGDDRTADGAKRMSKKTVEGVHVEIRVKEKKLFNLLKDEGFFVAVWAGLPPGALEVVFAPLSSASGGTRNLGPPRSEESATRGNGEEGAEAEDGTTSEGGEETELDASVREIEISIFRSSSTSSAFSAGGETLRGQSGETAAAGAWHMRAAAKMGNVEATEEEKDAEGEKGAEQGGGSFAAESERAARQRGKSQRLRRQIEELEARLAVPE